MKLVESPLNYTGGKFRLLPQILPLFPRNIATFVDLFCGGAAVGANVNCRSVRFNDDNEKLIGLLRTIRSLGISEALSTIDAIISAYGLSDTSRNGYAFYDSDSAKGLARVNREPFMKMRTALNSCAETGPDYYMLLYVAIVYSFNNQIRFNSKGKYNLPVGKRDFNRRMRAKFTAFSERLKSISAGFSALDFTDFDFGALTQDDFVYADPPYLITCAAYNENGGWSRERELQLLHTLDRLSERGIRFALSNVLASKGKKNEILHDWCRAHPEYTCHHLKFSYSNSNYHTKDRASFTDEVLVTNY